MIARPPAACAAAVGLGLLAAALIAGPAPAAAQAPAASETRMIAIDFGLRSLGIEFQTAHSFELHDEPGDFRTRYDAAKALAGNAGIAWRLGGRRLKGHLGFGFEFSMVRQPMAVALDARVPHPHILSFPREIDTAIPGVSRWETGIHVQGQYWRALSDNLLLRVFAGPTLFIAWQDAVTRIDTNDIEPEFDRAFLTGFDRGTAGARKMGYNIGFDVTWFLNGRVGLGVGVRYSRASITAHADPETPVPFAMGGPNLGGGVRWGF